MNLHELNIAIRENFDQITQLCDRKRCIRIKDISRYFNLNPNRIDDRLLLENVDTLETLVEIDDEYYELFDEENIPFRANLHQTEADDQFDPTRGLLPIDILKIHIPLIPIQIENKKTENELQLSPQDTRSCSNCRIYTDTHICELRGVKKHPGTPACQFFKTNYWLKQAQKK